MLARFVIALALGALLGIERELVGKEAGVRTLTVVAGGASIFAMIGLAIPYIAAQMLGSDPDRTMAVSGFGVIANVVVGIGFLGAGLIIKMNEHPRGITTAALVWTTAGVGILVGIGLSLFAAASAALIAILLYALRKLNISEKVEERSGKY